MILKFCTLFLLKICKGQIYFAISYSMLQNRCQTGMTGYHLIIYEILLFNLAFELVYRHVFKRRLLRLKSFESTFESMIQFLRNHKLITNY